VESVEKVEENESRKEEEKRQKTVFSFSWWFGEGKNINTTSSRDWG